ncbi:recombinase family protein [Vibrio cyclitrophicus]|uniref:recombinase family protein n=1 Tax=Vibrio atlanticus TaxID=693153 RepID=UPI0035517214
MKNVITTQAKTNPHTLPAYIYSRVSKTIQAEEGQGITRQINKAFEFIEATNRERVRDGLPIYEAVDELIVDKGLSAYLGANTSGNAGLGAFLEAVKSGKIPPRSLLVVEAVDRISRLKPSEARQIFMELAHYKIDVAITKFNLIVYHDNSNDFSSDILLTVGFHLAHQESKQKSERIKSSFALKREAEEDGGEKRTSICPAWMELSACKAEFILKQPEASILQRIFSLRLEQNIGADLIAQKLNAEGIPSFTGGEWYPEIVLKYLKMIQAYGAFQPTTSDYSSGKRKKVPLGICKENYYPAVVSKEDFDQVQASLRNAGKGQATVKYRNLFSGLTKCAYCGGSLSFSKGDRGLPKLRCRNSINKNCKLGRIGYFDYQPVENLLLNSFSCFDFSELNNNKDEGSLELLQAKIDRHAIELDELEKQIEVTSSPRLIMTLSAKFEELEQALDVLIAERTQNYSLQTIPDSETQELDLTSIECRSKYNKHITGFVDYVIVSHHCCYVKFKGNLGTIRLNYADRHYLKQNRGFLKSSEVIEAKVIKRLESTEYEVFQVDVDAFVEERNQKFSRLSSKSTPKSNDLLVSIRFVHAAMQEKSFHNTNAGIVSHMFDIAEKILLSQQNQRV